MTARSAFVRVLVVVLAMAGVSASTTAAAAPGGGPDGSLDQVTRTPGSYRVQGWTRDPDSADPIDAHLYVDGRFIEAQRAEWLYPGVGQGGFIFHVEVAEGPHDVCTYGINRGPGQNRLLGCIRIDHDASPFGSLDGTAVRPGGVLVRGWAIDPDTGDPVTVRVEGGSRPVSAVANQYRGDVAEAYFWFHSNGQSSYGFEIAAPAPPGPRQFCAIAQNVGPGRNRVLGCAILDVPANPFGALDLALRNNSTGEVAVRGWAIDPETDAPIDVHVYADGVHVGTTTATSERQDVGAATGFGNGHGYGFVVQPPGNAGRVCAYGINVGVAGQNTLLGCRTTDRSGDPRGRVTSASFSSGSPTTGTLHHGYALDPDTDAPIDVHAHDFGSGRPVFVGSVTAGNAGAQFGEPGEEYPGYGDNHGWSFGARHQQMLCFYAINAAGTPGTNRLIACTF